MGHAGEDLVGVGVGVLNNVGGEHGDGASQCTGLGAFELGGTGEHAVHQVGTGGEHSTVEVGSDVVNALGDDGQRCLDNGAGLFGEHRCVPSSCNSHPWEPEASRAGVDDGHEVYRGSLRW